METTSSPSSHGLSNDRQQFDELLHGAQRLLEKSGAEQFEIYFQRKTTTRIDSKDQQIDTLSRSEDVGMSVRVIKDRRSGFSFTTALNRSAIERMVQSALDIAQVMPEDEFLSLPSYGSFVYPAIDAWDSKGVLVPISKKADMAKQLEAACRKADKRITGVRSATVSESLGEIHLIDSSGEHIHHHGTTFGASITCKAEENGDSQMGGDMHYTHFLENLDVDHVARLAAGWATEILNAGDAPTMNCPAVLRNSVVADLIDFLSSSFSAEAIEKGRSMLAGKFGHPLFSEHVSIMDDGLLAGGLASSPFDAEGCPSHQTILIDRGTITGTLYDTYYARKAGRASTGNAVRSIKSPPQIGTTNLLMRPGRRSAQALMNGITQGILITDLMGLHTANSVTGDFSLGATGILIENGKLTRPVRGFAVAGNVLDLFKEMTDIGNDLRFFGTVGAPSVRVGKLSVGGK